jgi:hypothetical protein
MKNNIKKNNIDKIYKELSDTEYKKTINIKKYNGAGGLRGIYPGI